MSLPAPKIGVYSYPEHFVDWEAIQPFQIPQKNVGTFLQDGVDDYGALVGSKVPDLGIYRTEAYALTKPDAWAIVHNYNDLVGTLVNVTDEDGVNWRGVLVKKILYRKIPVATPTLYTSVEAFWHLIPSSQVS